MHAHLVPTLLLNLLKTIGEPLIVACALAKYGSSCHSKARILTLLQTPSVKKA